MLRNSALLSDNETIGQKYWNGRAKEISHLIDLSKACDLLASIYMADETTCNSSSSWIDIFCWFLWASGHAFTCTQAKHICTHNTTIKYKTIRKHFNDTQSNLIIKLVVIHLKSTLRWKFWFRHSPLFLISNQFALSLHCYLYLDLNSMKLFLSSNM